MIHQSRWNRSSRRIGLALAALLLLSVAAQAQSQLLARSKTGPPGYQGREENEIIDIDLEASAFKTTLPFDVAFKVKGPMPEKFDTTARLDARFVEFNRVPDCKTFFSQFRVSTDRLSDLEAADAIPVRERRPALAIESSGFRQAEVFVGGRTIESIPIGSLVQLGALIEEAEAEAQKASFLVSFPALRPNHYYCFQFISRRALADEELAELQGEFAKVVDAELRDKKYQQVQDAGGEEAVTFVVETGDYESLRDTLTALIESKLTTPDQVVLAPRNSFFDVATDLDGIGAPYREEFERIAETTVDTRLGAINNFEADVEEAVDLLGEISQLDFSDEDATETLSLRSLLIDADSSVLDRIAEIEADTGIDLLSLLALSATGRRELIGGVAEDEADPTELRQVWGESDEVAPIGDWIRNIRELSRAVGELDDLAELAGYDPAFFEGGDSGFEELAPGDPALAALAAAADGEDEEEPSNLVDEVVAKLDAAVDNLGLLQGTLADRSDRILAWVEQILVEEKKSLVVGASTIAKYDTRAIWYMSADLGAGLSPDTEDLFTYVGWNIYFRPVNKKAHLSWAGRPFGLREEFMRRFSVTLGIVQDGFEQEGPLYQGVIGSNAAVVGAGFRINDSLRFSIGGLVFENEDRDPLISSTTLNWAPYAAISFDWNATATIAGLFAKP
jgi:hypothetical protein